jgi:phosphohistidine phosphatase
VRVYLVQHGRAKSEEEEPQRRLTDKGIGEVQKVAVFLRPLELRIDAVWHSGKARAQQTAELPGATFQKIFALVLIRPGTKDCFIPH